MTTLIEKLTATVSIYDSATNKVNYLQPLGSLAARIYIAWVFFASGLTKLRDWESTLFLFEEEYAVPFINFELAAWLGTAGELILPVLLVLGLLGRFAAIGLSVVNIVAVVSLEAIAPAAYTLHVLWGLVLVHLIVWGPGVISLDRVLKWKLLK